MQIRLSLGPLGLLGLLAGSSAALAQGAPHERLEALAREVTFTFARMYPMVATQLGIPGHDGELEQPSEANRAATIEQLQRWQAQLHAITAAMDVHAPLADRNDAKLLDAQLTLQLNQFLVYRTDRKDYAAPALNLVNAVYTQFEHLPEAGKNGATRADVERAWADITARLAAAPGYLRAARALVTTPCHLFGVVGSRELAGMPQFLNETLTQAARTQLGAQSEAFSRFVRARDAAVAAFAASRTYIDAHVASWPENFAIGRAAYDHMLSDEQLLPFNADDVQRMGQDELAHGWAEEAWLTALSRLRSLPFGAASGGGMAPAGPALIDYYRARIEQLRRFISDTDVVTIPAWLGTISVTETPTFLQPISPGASMNPPRVFSPSGKAFYYITPPKSLAEAAAHLDMNQDFDRDRILSTAAHEVMPGHFLQLSIARRHPNFIRKIASSSAFEEGWAFYGEEMFVRLGLYGDDLDGRLFTARWERVRGARAVVDPALATGAWTYEKAVEYFAEQADFTREAAEAEVASFAVQPGYVIAYTVGRAQLEALLGEYTRRMGARGSLRDFHDRLLSYGSVPFAIVAPELLADLSKPASEVRAAANY